MAANRTAGSPRVGVCAVTGRDDCLLPGATITGLDFYAVVDHLASEPDQPRGSESAFLFDLTLCDPLDCLPPRTFRRATANELSLLPEEIRDALIAGRASASNLWKIRML